MGSKKFSHAVQKRFQNVFDTNISLYYLLSQRSGFQLGSLTNAILESHSSYFNLTHVTNQ